MAETELPPPCGHKDGLGDFAGMPSSSGDVNPPIPSGSKDGLGNFTGFPDSSGDVHPVPPC